MRAPQGEVFEGFLRGAGDQARTSDEMRNYLEKYVMTFNGASTMVKDLRRFLEYIDFPTCIGDRPVYYAEQSTCVRRFKE